MVLDNLSWNNASVILSHYKRWSCVTSGRNFSHYTFKFISHEVRETAENHSSSQGVQFHWRLIRVSEVSWSTCNRETATDGAFGKQSWFRAEPETNGIQIDFPEKRLVLIGRSFSLRSRLVRGQVRLASSMSCPHEGQLSTLPTNNNQSVYLEEINSFLPATAVFLSQINLRRRSAEQKTVFKRIVVR